MNRVAVLVAAVVCIVAIPVAGTGAAAAGDSGPRAPTPRQGSSVGGSERALATALGETEMAWTPRKGTQTWEEFIADWLTPREVEKSIAVRIDEKYAYPHPAVSLKMEIVKEDEDTLWLRGIPPEDPVSPLHDLWSQRQGEERMHEEPNGLGA